MFTPGLGAEESALDFVDTMSRLLDAQGPSDWVYKSHYQLLAQHGRFFTPGPLPHAVKKMPKKGCWGNAATTARVYPGLAYAEGVMVIVSGGSYFCVDHGWCVDSDGVVVDPTTDDGVAYFGVAFADSTWWPPLSGQGVFTHRDWFAPILSKQLPADALANIGRPRQGTAVTTAGSHAEL
ncbi:hypothetical protein [Nocardia sp. NPDC050435]|uniref:hypothetical protein n=1 Tax=Nocardia sp. NPDC050435 TaxID=3155040 RepID=UPI0034015235